MCFMVKKSVKRTRGMAKQWKERNREREKKKYTERGRGSVFFCKKKIFHKMLQKFSNVICASTSMPYAFLHFREDAVGEDAVIAKI